MTYDARLNTDHSLLPLIRIKYVPRPSNDFTMSRCSMSDDILRRDAL